MRVVPSSVLALVLAAPLGAQELPARSIDPPAAEGAMAPGLARDGEDVLLSWLEPTAHETGSPPRPDAHRLRFARLHEGAWSAPRTIAERDDFFANWADLPSIVQGGDGSLYAHWLQRAGKGTYAYHVVLARSTDGGLGWQVLGRAHPDDDSETEHGFVSLVPESSGTRAFWLDGRAMSAGHGAAGGHGAGDMQLRTALVGERVGAGVVLDPRVCECCNTAAVLTAKGPLVAYRARSEDEVRDIYVVRKRGEEWTEPRPVHRDGWTIAGCPVNGPALDARGERVAVAWFTGAPQRPGVKVAFSDDAGARFGPPVVVDAATTLGRVDIALDAAGMAVVCWLADAGSRAQVRLQRIAPKGAEGEPIVVAEVDASRASGFPKLARVANGYLVVWIASGPKGGLRASLVSL